MTTAACAGLACGLADGRLGRQLRLAAGRVSAFDGGWPDESRQGGKVMYPRFFEKMPYADLPVPTARARMVASDDALVIFYDFVEDTEVSMHAHGGQWGVVLKGTFELTIGDETRTVGPGETYEIPAGVMHGARVPAGVKLIDVFEDADRYKPKR